MSTVAALLVVVVAAIHVYIVVLEMFLWRTTRGMRAFGTDQAFADASAKLAANQGLYNGFLVAGLVWGLLAGGTIGFQVKLFFLACVIVAGTARPVNAPDPGSAVRPARTVKRAGSWWSRARRPAGRADGGARRPGIACAAGSGT